MFECKIEGLNKIIRVERIEDFATFVTICLENNLIVTISKVEKEK